VGDFKTFSAIKYDDPYACTDMSVLGMSDDVKAFVPIASGSAVTFVATIIEWADDRRANYPNKFSFIPEAGKDYTVKLSINVKDITYGQCDLSVFDGGSVTFIQIISRPKSPPYWTKTSSRCDKQEFEQVKTAELGTEASRCLIYVGGYSC